MIDVIELFKWLTIIVLGISIGMFFAFTIVSEPTKNTFFSTFWNSPSFGRRKEIRQLADRVRSGQSSAIISFFSEERRTILGYLRNEDPAQQQELYGDNAEQLIFSYMDIAFLDQECSQSKFWEMALEPLRLKIVPGSKLEQAYQTSKDNNFDKPSLENIISLINQQGWRLVLLLDRFEDLLEHPNFKKNWKFFTTLRALAALRTPSPLTLIIATYSSLGEFHRKIQHLSPSVSPVLNFIGVTTVLGSLSAVEIDNLLDENDLPLSQTNRQLIKDMAGGHPYLLKIIVAEFQKILQNGEIQSFEAIENTFCQGIAPMLENMVMSWPSRTCQAFFKVAKNHHVPNTEIKEFKNEMKELEMQGLVAKINGQWQIRSHIFSKCLVGKDTQQLCIEKQRLEI